MTSTHETNTRRDQIVISLGVSTYWLSIVEEMGSLGEHDKKEIALVTYDKEAPFSVYLVPLQFWFDSSSHETENTVNLKNFNTYHLLGDGATEADVLSAVIARAFAYINFKKNQ